MYVKDGTVSSTSQSVEITFKGRGAHGSMPAASIDPIVIGAHFVSDVQTIVSSRKNPAAFGVVTVGSFQSGTVGNIIPNEAVLKLTLRSYSPEVAKLLLDGVLRTAKASADMANAPAPELKVPGSIASVVNNSGLVGRTSKVMKTAFNYGRSWLRPLRHRLPPARTSPNSSARACRRSSSASATQTAGPCRCQGQRHIRAGKSFTVVCPGPGAGNQDRRRRPHPCGAGRRFAGYRIKRPPHSRFG